VQAYEEYRSAAELLWRAKQRPVTNGDEARARWQEIQEYSGRLKEAEDGLWASVIDALEPV
jgi:hypothetical protein